MVFTIIFVEPPVNKLSFFYEAKLKKDRGFACYFFLRYSVLLVHRDATPYHMSLVIVKLP